MLKVCMSAIVWSFVCIGNFVVVVSGEQDTQNQKIARLAKAGAPEELAKCISAVLPRIPKGDLDSLVGNEDCTVALAAGWERVRRTVPNEEQRIPIPPQSQSISQFIGLLEGSTRVSIPHFWKDAVQNANSYGRQNIWFPEPKTMNAVTTNSTNGASAASLTREGQRWIVKQGNETWSILADDQLVGIWPGEQIGVKLTGEVAYVYLYFWPPIPYKLCAIDRRSSKVIWSSLVWAAGGMKTYTGQGWHQAELTLTSGNITVFGVAGDTAYVEMFDRKTGKNIVRFSTSYFNLVEGTSDK